MRNFDQSEPLTETELEHLNEFLKSYKGGKAMNIEEVDGFFSALIAGPEIVMSGEYFPELFGSAAPETHAFSTLAEANEILGLLTRHWNSIAGALSRDEVYLPLLVKADNGLEHGNDWAHGFIRGTRLRFDGWAELVNEQDNGGCMIPMMMLYHEHDEDLSLRPKPIGFEQRERLYESMAAGLLAAYRYFRQYEKVSESTHGPKSLYTNVKIGRNDLCPAAPGRNTSVAAAVQLFTRAGMAGRQTNNRYLILWTGPSLTGWLAY